MKKGYISLVLAGDSSLDRESLADLDARLSEVAEDHEIVIVVRALTQDAHTLTALCDNAGLVSPVTLVVTWHGSTRDASLMAGLSQAVGDFVIDWNASPRDLTPAMLSEMVEAVNEGYDIVEFCPARQSRTSRAFYRVANAFRPKTSPLRPTFARLFSRRALDLAIAAGRSLPNRLLLVASMGLPRKLTFHDIHRAPSQRYRERWGEALTVLTRGTRAASVLPAVGAFAFALFSFATAVFALALFFWRGQAPEGWTTLMVVVGFGLAAVLTSLGLLWERVESLSRTIEQPHDATAQVLVFPASGRSAP